MFLTVAGNKKEYEDGITVAQLIEWENVETPQYVTVSINDDFVENGTWETTVLRGGDTVEFLYFMGGGNERENGILFFAKRQK
ncbi:MAG: sulfur carrier protein ThiS [Planctomycetaceae bacterium]|jgi:sulfur carrier protein|nr:sulfur carrier protein ThiS [Planctomycetaceae bacterium]